jgi:hypothetical protein
MHLIQSKLLTKGFLGAGELKLIFGPWVALTFLCQDGRLTVNIGVALKGRTVKYAFKTGICTAILAAPAFLDVTRPFFLEYYGDWALISVRLVHLPLDVGCLSG